MNKKGIIIIIIIIIFIFIISAVGGFVLGSVYYKNTKGEIVETIILEGMSEGEVPKCLDNVFIKTYEEFKEYIKNFNIVKINDSDDNIYDVNVLDYFNEEYFLEHTLAIVEVYDGRANSIFSYTIDSIRKKDNEINININLKMLSENYTKTSYSSFNFILLDKNIETVNFYVKNNIPTADKPVIYLYPSDETNVNIKLGYKENVTVSYPEYIDGWNVLAKPNGRLIDLDTNRELYSLYYECKNAIKFDMTSEGFIVKGKDIVPFLEEKLSILGLNNIEAEEFIIYWLPILSKNEYNYIRFATEEEINKNMPLNIEPNPETIIRVLMIYKGLEEKVDVVEQKLTTPQRNGFVAVEWGATEIK